MALGIGKNDIVITVPFTFIATPESIKLVGADVIFSDIDDKTLNMCPKKLSSTIDNLKKDGLISRLKAIIVVDLFGNPADYEQIQMLTKEHNIFLIRDAAQSFGSLYQQKHIANHCDVSSISFYPTKTLSCYGEGGAVFTFSKSIADKLYAIRNHGIFKDESKVSILGLNGRFDTIQAIIILEKLKIYKEELKKRQEIAQYYKKNISSSYVIQNITSNAKSTYSQFPVICNEVKRDIVISLLDENKIPFKIYYEKTLSSLSPFNDNLYSSNLDNSNNITSRILNLPIHPYLLDKDVKKVVEVLNRLG